MQLAVAPPVLPMLAKRVERAVRTAPAGSSSPSGTASACSSSATATSCCSRAATRSRSTATSPSCASRSRRSFRARCVLDGEIVIATPDGARLRGAPAAHPSGRVARLQLLAQQIPASIVFFDLLCEGERDLRELRSASGGASSRRCSPDAKPPLHLTPATADRDVAADWFRRFEGAGLDGVIAKPAAGALRAEQARDAEGQARARVRLRGRGLPLAQERRGTKPSARCCSASTTTPARSSTSASRRASAMPKRRELVAIPGAVSRGRAETIIRGSSGRSAGVESTQRMPGAKSRWSQGKDLSWEPLRPELVVEVAYDHMQGTRFRHTAQFRRWRTRQAAARLHLRAARGRRAARARGDLRDGAELTPRLPCGAPPLARRIVVRVGRLLRRAQRFRDVPQVDAHARPGRRAAAHRVDQHVVAASCAATSGCRAFQRSSPPARPPARRVRDHEQRHSRARGFARALRARRRDARRLALHLAEVRRPRRVAEARGLVARRELEQRSSEPAAASIPACRSPISAKRSGTVAP